MGACQSRDATEPPASNIQTVTPTKEGQPQTVDAVVSPASSPVNMQAVVPIVGAYVPPAGAWTPEREEEKRRAKLAELKRQNEIEIARATAHLRQKSSSKDRRSSRHHQRPSSSMQSSPVESTTQQAIDTEQSVNQSIKQDAEISIQTGVQSSPPRSITRQLNSPVIADSSMPLSRSERRARASSQSVTPSLTRETSRVESRSEHRASIDKTLRKDWNYDAMPGERGDSTRLRNQSSRHVHSQSISHSASAPSTPPQPRRATFGESTQLKTVNEPAAEEVSVSSSTSMSNIDTTPVKSVVSTTNEQQSPGYQGVRLRSAPVTPRGASAAPRFQSVSPTAADASAVFGVKLRKATPNSPSSSTPVTTVTASVA